MLIRIVWGVLSIAFVIFAIAVGMAAGEHSPAGGMVIALFIAWIAAQFARAALFGHELS